MKRVVVTGLGVISPLGGTVSSFFDSLLACRSGIALLQAPWAQSIRAPIAASVIENIESQFPKPKRASLDRVVQLSLIAARQAMQQAKINLGDAASERAGVYWGTGMGGATTLEQTYVDILVNRTARLRPATVVMAMNNAASGHIGIEFGIRGPSYTFSSACSSSAVAIGEAFRAIRFNLVDTAIAGGGEALLTEGVMKAWDSLQTLAHMDTGKPETSCRPFAADRTGFVLGEGAAALVLEERDAALARGATILAEIVGYGNTTDSHHITQPDAPGQARAMQRALVEAEMSPERIGHINAHGTGTKVGDLSETLAIKQVFGDHAGHIPISATKALHGHLMGAAGALEMVAALEAMRGGIVPPTAHLFNPDAECDLDYVSSGARKIPGLNAVMSNSFGFGGNNVSLIAIRGSST